MVYCHPSHLSQISRYKLLALLKSPATALKKATKKPWNNNYTHRNPTVTTTTKNKDELLDAFTKEFSHKTYPNTKMSRRLYIVNEQTAITIGQHLSASDPNHPAVTTIVETNPGLGVLTSVLLRNGVKDLRLFEARAEFVADLTEDYSDVYPDRVKLKHADILNLHKSIYVDKIYGTTTRTDNILGNLPTTEWQSDNINFRLFGATGSIIFFKHLISSIVHQNSILTLGRCELFMAVPSSIYLDMTRSPKAGYDWYRPFAILFQIFFEYKLLDKFSRTDFLPHIIHKTEKPSKSETRKAVRYSGTKIPPVDQELMYFVKIVPRRNLYQLCPPNEIVELLHFIRRNCFIRSNKIIPTLEKYIPGCGIRLLLKFNTANAVRSQPIDVKHLCEAPSITNLSCTLSNQDYYDNLNVNTEFGDLQPTQLLPLFSEFRMIPGYSSSNFLPSLESVLVKFEAPSDGIETAKVKDSRRRR